MPRSTTARRISLTAAFLGLAAGGTAACDADPPPRRPTVPYVPAPTPTPAGPTAGLPLGTRNPTVPDGTVRTGIVGQGGTDSGSSGG